RRERRADLAPGGPVAPLEERPLATVRVRLEVSQRGVDRAVHWHAAGLATFRLIQRDPTRRQVDALPLQPKDLRLAHAGVDGEHDDGPQVWILRRAARRQ